MNTLLLQDILKYILNIENKDKTIYFVDNNNTFFSIYVYLYTNNDTLMIEFENIYILENRNKIFDRLTEKEIKKLQSCLKLIGIKNYIISTDKLNEIKKSTSDKLNVINSFILKTYIRYKETKDNKSKYLIEKNIKSIYNDLLYINLDNEICWLYIQEGLTYKYINNIDIFYGGRYNAEYSSIFSNYAIKRHYFRKRL